jgi:teichuronic acid biosynthesis glycosyltransferase TuaC
MQNDELRVLVISRLYPRPSDPVCGIFVEEEVRRLAGLCRVKVVAPIPWFPRLTFFKRWYDHAQTPRYETRRGIEVFRARTLMFPRNLLFSLLGFSMYISLKRRVREIERQFTPDLIHAHTAYPDGFAAVKLGQALHRPVVVTLHGGDVNVHFRRYLWRRMGLWALSGARQVIAVSYSLRRKAVDYGVETPKVTVIPNGVDVTRFAPVPRAEALRQLGLNDDGARVLYVGGIERSKGIGFLLKAAKMVLGGVNRPVEFVLIGDGAYKERAMLLAQEVGITTAVRFVEKRPNQDIPLWINACDLLVLPSLSEGFGVVLIEAMACGKPVVSTRCGGPEDIVTPETGLLVAPGDEAALAEAMDRILKGKCVFDPRRIRKHAEDNYAYDGIASRIVSVYRTALES